MLLTTTTRNTSLGSIYRSSLQVDQEMFEDTKGGNQPSLKIPTKGVIRIRQSKNRQHNGQIKRTNNDLQSIAHTTKDRAT